MFESCERTSNDPVGTLAERVAKIERLLAPLLSAAAMAEQAASYQAKMIAAHERVAHWKKIADERGEGLIKVDEELRELKARLEQLEAK